MFRKDIKNIMKRSENDFNQNDGDRTSQVSK